MSTSWNPCWSIGEWGQVNGSEWKGQVTLMEEPPAAWGLDSEICFLRLEDGEGNIWEGLNAFATKKDGLHYTGNVKKTSAPPVKTEA